MDRRPRRVLFVVETHRRVANGAKSHVDDLGRENLPGGGGEKCRKSLAEREHRVAVRQLKTATRKPCD